MGSHLPCKGFSVETYEDFENLLQRAAEHGGAWGEDRDGQRRIRQMERRGRARVIRGYLWLSARLVLA